MKKLEIIGVDVAKNKLDIYAIVDQVIRKNVFSNTEAGWKHLVDWIGHLGMVDPHVCMESTGCYSEGVAEFLYEAKFAVSVVNPSQIKAFRLSKMVRQKTDSSDAKIIAEFCLQNNPRLWSPKSRIKKELHEISVHLEALKKNLNQLTNFLERKIANNTVQSSIVKEVNCIEELIEELEAEAKKIIEKEEDLKQKYHLLTEIKGVGPKMAVAILAHMPDVSNFKSAKQFAAYVGVTPSHFQSGTSVHGASHISRLGSRRIRNVLYMSALVVKNRNQHFRNFVQKLIKKGKYPKVIIVAIMRKLMHIFFGILKNLTSFNENLAFPS